MVETWLRLPDGVRVATRQDGAMEARWGDRRELLDVHPSALEPDKLLASLRGGEERAQAYALARAAPDGCGVQLLDELWIGGFIEVEIRQHGAPFVRIRPRRSLAARRPGGAGATTPGTSGSDLVLRPLATVSFTDEAPVLDAPGARASVELPHHDAVSLVAAHSGTAAKAPPEPSEIATVVRRHLADVGLLVTPAQAREVRDSTRSWSSHEVWFHLLSRRGDQSRDRHVGPVEIDTDARVHPPATRPRYDGPSITLATAPRERTGGTTAATTIDDRRSIRLHDDAAPLTVDQLGAFLDRCCRVRETYEFRGLEHSRRPYPSGGAAYELEVYVVARLVVGLQPGLFHYDALGHQLTRLAAPRRACARLLHSAMQCVISDRPPQSLLIITARFERMLGRYRSMGYATTLKNVGALYQTMYLSATTMGLAGCAVGVGDVDDFAAATGLPVFAESSVGEFLLGAGPALGDQ